MFYRISFFLCLLSFYSCSSNNEKKVITDDGYFEKGLVNKLGNFEGKVYKLDSNNNIVGYSTYKNGILNGPSVKFNTSLKLLDSLNYKDDELDGYSFFYDEKGKLERKGNYLKGHPLGDIIEYDTSGNVVYYAFLDFSYKTLFEEKLINNRDVLDRGSLINFVIVNFNTVDNEPIKKLFLYTIKTYFSNIKFSLAVKNKEGKIYNEKSINMEGVFIEEPLPKLPIGESNVLIFYKYNFDKKLYQKINTINLDEVEMMGFNNYQHQ